MDKLARYPEIIRQLIFDYASHKPAIAIAPNRLFTHWTAHNFSSFTTPPSIASTVNL